MKKRFLTALLALCMVAALVPAFAVPAAAATENYTLYLNNSNGRLYENNLSGADITDKMASSGAQVSGSSGSRTLTLTNFNFETSADYAMQVPDGTTIVLVGSNAVTSTYNGGGYYSHGIYSDGNLTINGTGSLTAKGGAGTESSGIYSGNNLSISGSATVNATGGNNGKSGNYGSDGSCGIYSEGNLTISGSAVVKATGGTLPSGSSFGIFTGRDITISGSATVNTTGSRSSYFSFGMVAVNKLAIGDSSSVTATSGEAGDGGSFAILVENGTVTINSNATVTATGSTGKVGVGMSASSTVTVSGSATLNATGGAAQTGYGILLDGSLLIGGGTVTASGSTRAIDPNYTVANSHKYTVSAVKDGANAVTGTSNGSFVINSTHKYAKIEYGASATSGSIAIENTANGTVTVSNNTPSNGQTITVTATPDNGYELDTLTVTEAGGNALSCTKNENGTHTFTFTSGTVTVTAKFKAVTGSQPIPEMPFTDVNADDWFYNNVKYVYDNSLFNGVTTTTFEPYMAMTRGMIVTVLGRLSGIDHDDYTGASYDDVDVSIYYAPYIKWASANGIVTGIGNNKFDPDTIISRQDLATIMYRYAQTTNKKFPVVKDKQIFNDSNLISDYAAPAVEAIQRAGIINGKLDNMFDPRGHANRAEVAAMLHGYILTVK